jgi:hypothetical protein
MHCHFCKNNTLLLGRRHRKLFDGHVDFVPGDGIPQLGVEYLNPSAPLGNDRSKDQAVSRKFGQTDHRHDCRVSAMAAAKGDNVLDRGPLSTVTSKFVPPKYRWDFFGHISPHPLFCRAKSGQTRFSFVGACGAGCVFHASGAVEHGIDG